MVSRETKADKRKGLACGAPINLGGGAAGVRASVLCCVVLCVGCCMCVLHVCVHECVVRVRVVRVLLFVPS